MKNLFNNQIAEVKVTYINTVPPKERLKVLTSKDAYNILLNAWSDDIDYVEEFVVLLLNKANRVLGAVPISKGGVTGTVADPKVIFQAALVGSASSIILAHNHPSGNMGPSDADIKLTKKLKNAGSFLDIAVLDHLIISRFEYYSFADEGMM